MIEEKSISTSPTFLNSTMGDKLLANSGVNLLALIYDLTYDIAKLPWQRLAPISLYNKQVKNPGL